MEKYIVTRHFRCTKEESDLINERAAKERKSRSAYLRDAALSRNEPKVDEKVAQILKQFQENELKIGVNINQAVRICNSKKNVSREDYEKLTGMLLQIMEYRKRMNDVLIKMACG